MTDFEVKALQPTSSPGEEEGPNGIMIVRPDGSYQGSHWHIDGDPDDPRQCDRLGVTGDGTAWRATGGIKQISKFSHVTPTELAGSSSLGWRNSVMAVLSDGTVTEPISVPSVANDAWEFSTNASGVLPGLASGPPGLVLVDTKNASYHTYSLPYPSWLPKGTWHKSGAEDEESARWRERLTSPPDWLMLDDQQRYWLGFTLSQSGIKVTNWSPWHRSATRLAWESGTAKHIPELRVAIWRPGKGVEWRSYPWPSCGPSGPSFTATPFELIKGLTAGCDGMSADVQELGPFVRFSWHAAYRYDAEGNPVKAISGFPWYAPGSKDKPDPTRTFTRIMTWKAFYDAGKPIP